VHRAKAITKTRTDGLRVLVGLAFGRSTRVFTVVGKFVGETVGSNSVRVDNGGTTTSNHGPDTALGVQDGELEGSTSRGIELLDVSFLLGQITTEGCRPDLKSNVRITPIELKHR